MLAHEGREGKMSVPGGTTVLKALCRVMNGPLIHFDTARGLYQIAPGVGADGSSGRDPCSVMSNTCILYEKQSFLASGRGLGRGPDNPM